VFTAAAWLYFAQSEVDVAVMEVGLGGRLDATNVCDRPLISIITSISRDHWQNLGPTLADIAREKAGILKPGCPAVVGPLPPVAAAVVQERITALRCPAVWPEPALVRTAETQRTQRQALYQGIEYSLPLPGEFQLTNSAVAIAALQVLQQLGWDISKEAIATGMAKALWPGRLEWTTWQNHQLLIDGAHNSDAAIALRQYVDTLDVDVTWVMGMLSTKDHAEILSALLRPGDRLYVVPIPDHGSANPAELVILAHNICPELSDRRAYPDLVTALEAAVTSENLIVLCGSLYLVGHFLRTAKTQRKQREELS
jgi:dihydrofolate synthase/folylpolyglutamate synthase